MISQGKIDEKSTENRPKIDPGAILKRSEGSGAVRGRRGTWPRASQTHPSRSKSDLGTLWAAQDCHQECPGSGRRASRRRPDDSRTHPKLVLNVNPCANTSHDECLSFLAPRARALMWQKHSSCRCFVRFGRGEHRTGTRSETSQKTIIFDHQNRAWDRPSHPKSSPSAHVRAEKRSMSARSQAIFSRERLA